jgi:hypothetical protein
MIRESKQRHALGSLLAAELRSATVQPLDLFHTDTLHMRRRSITGNIHPVLSVALNINVESMHTKAVTLLAFYLCGHTSSGSSNRSRRKSGHEERSTVRLL